MHQKVATKLLKKTILSQMCQNTLDLAENKKSFSAKCSKKSHFWLRIVFRLQKPKNTEGSSFIVKKKISIKMTTTNIILVLTTTTTALIAGLLYGYSCSVNLGLGQLPDAEYISAMQSINRAIQNPLFFISFMGTLLLLPLSTYLHYGQPISTRFWLLLAATVVYIVGVIGVTALGNIPLNTLLEGFNLKSASAETMESERAKFEGAWNQFHSIRTVAAVVSLVLTIVACLNSSVHKTE